MKSAISSFIKRDILNDRADLELTDDEDLLGSGLVDSLGIMRLIAFVENEYQITVPLEDMTIENFMTVNAIANYLDGKRAD